MAGRDPYYPYPPHPQYPQHPQHPPHPQHPQSVEGYEDYEEGDLWPYFVEGDGIEHRVIHTDLPRYLGNDATLKRGSKNGVPGFFYNAYRPLTTAMVESLKADTRRWLEERDSLRYQKPDLEYYNSRTLRESRRRQQRGDSSRAELASPEEPPAPPPPPAVVQSRPANPAHHYGPEGYPPRPDHVPPPASTMPAYTYGIPEYPPPQAYPSGSRRQVQETTAPRYAAPGYPGYDYGPTEPPVTQAPPQPAPEQAMWPATHRREYPPGHRPDPYAAYRPRD